MNHLIICMRYIQWLINLDILHKRSGLTKEKKIMYFAFFHCPWSKIYRAQNDTDRGDRIYSKVKTI